MQCIHVLTRPLVVMLRLNLTANRRAIKLKVHIFVTPGWHHQIFVHPLEQSSLTEGRLGGNISAGSYCPGRSPAGAGGHCPPILSVTQTAKRSRFHSYNQQSFNPMECMDILHIYQKIHIYVQCSRWPVHPSMHGFNLKYFRHLKWQSLDMLPSRTMHPQTQDCKLLSTQPSKLSLTRNRFSECCGKKKSQINNVLHISVVSSGYLSCCCCPSSQLSLTSDLWLLTLTRHFSAHSCSFPNIFYFFGSASPTQKIMLSLSSRLLNTSTTK